MSVNPALKRNISSMQVLKTLRLLMEGNYSMAELIQKLNLNEQEPIFNNSVVSKYINTCRACGIDIPKINNKYFVAKVPFGLDLTTKDLDLLKHLQIIAKDSMSGRQNNIIDSFLNKINLFSNKQILRVEKKTSSITHQAFYDAVEEKRMINLMFKIKTNMKCLPLGIIEHKGRLFFNVINNNKEKLVCEERISGIEVLPQKFSRNNPDKEVEFILKGELAKRYSSRENETVTKENGFIRVVNKGENREVLLSRLLRYDISCEIVKPESYREEMKRILEDTLGNYGV